MNRLLLRSLLATLIFTTLADEKPVSTEELLKNAMFHERFTGDTIKAVDCYAEILKRKDTKFTDRARLGLAVCAVRQGNVDLAVSQFGDLFSSNPELAKQYLSKLRQLPCSSIATNTPGRKQRSAFKRRLDSIILPGLNIKRKTIKEAFASLQALSKMHDPKRAGVNFQLVLEQEPLVPPDEPLPDEPADEKQVNVQLNQSSLLQAIHLVCGPHGLRPVFEADHVVILGPNMTHQKLHRAFIPINLRLFCAGEDEDEDEDEEVEISFLDFFKDKGVKFPDTLSDGPATVDYDRGTSKLFVRHTKEGILEIRRIIDELNRSIPQVSIRVDLVEIDVSESLLMSKKLSELPALIAALPDQKLQYLNSVSILVQSCEEGFVELQGPMQWIGEKAYGDTSLTATPQVAEDGESISIACHWHSEAYSSRPAWSALKRNKELSHFLPSWKGELRTKFTVKAGNTMCFKLAPRRPTTKKGAMYLLMRAELVAR